MKTVKEPKKKSPTRKTSVKATKPATTTTAPLALAPAPKATRTLPTTIEAKIDVGFGNSLFVRGQGGGLSWERGIPLKNVDSSTWQWSANATDTLVFKLLLNDTVWAQGEDVKAAPGQKIEIAPAF